MNKPHVAFLVIARNTFDTELAKEVSDQAYQHISQLPIELNRPTDLIENVDEAESVAATLAETQPDLVVIFQATFADSSMTMRLAEEIDSPILLWAVPEEHTGERLRLNSFCGINLAGHALTRAGRQYDHLFAPPNDNITLKKIQSLARAGYARNLLRRSRLGRTGKNPDGFETCILNIDLIKKNFGLEVVQYDLVEEIFPLIKNVQANRVDEIEAEIAEEVNGLDQLDKEAARGTMGVYAVLKQLSEQNNLQGFAVRCWPEFFTHLGCAACGALSMLNNDKIPCSCESDINGTITQMILQAMSGEPAFGTDIVSIEDERDAVVIWHCGQAPLSMADPQKPTGVTIHSNRKLPLLFEFTLKPGTVTIARLSETTGEYRLVIGRGEIIRGPKTFSGTSGLLQFDLPAKDFLNFILEEGLEHHISITYGDHTDALEAFAKYTNIKTIHFNAGGGANR